MSLELLEVCKDVTKIVDMFADMIEKQNHSNELISGVSQDIGGNLGYANGGIDQIIERLNKSEKNYSPFGRC